MAVTLTRRFHAVGQGLFCSEHVYADGENVFNAVYDCGSNNNGPCRIRVNEMKEIVGPSGKIDYLFISHFHDDHINCLDMLTDEFDVDKIVLPQLSPYQKIRAFALESDGGSYSKKYSDLRRKIFTGSLRANEYIEIPNFDSPSLPNINVSNNEETYHEFDLYRMTVDKSDISCKIIDDVYVMYIPFYVESEMSKRFMEEVKRTNPQVIEAAEKNDFSNLEELLGNDAFGKLKKQYRFSYGSNMNESSMTVLSVPCRSGMSALYNGDFPYRISASDLLVRIYYRREWHDIETILASHHGSKKDNPIELYSKGGNNCVVSYGANNNYGHPYRAGITEIAQKGFTVHEITENTNSLELTYTLK